MTAEQREYAILVDQHGDITLTEARHVHAIQARDPSERVVLTARHSTWEQAKAWAALASEVLR